MHLKGADLLAIKPFLLAAVPVVDTPSTMLVGVNGSGVHIEIRIQSAYPGVTSNQISWFHERDMATPLTEASDNRYNFTNGMRNLYIYPVKYKDEGDYIIRIYHVTGNQSITIHLNVQGKQLCW